ncbi:MAG: hypothetical protein AVDCRST_MAG04-3120, partial [uncultured Acetobacteraceae bacterium]
EARRLLPLWRRAVPAALRASLPLPALLLLDLPQDGGRGRLRHQPRRRRDEPPGVRPPARLGLPRQAARTGRDPRPPQPGGAALLRPVRQRPLALRQALAGPHPPLRLGRGHALAGRAALHAHDAGVQGALGGAADQAGRQAVRRVPGRKHRRLARTARPGAGRGGV